MTPEQRKRKRQMYPGAKVLGSSPLGRVVCNSALKRALAVIVPRNPKRQLDKLADGD